MFKLTKLHYELLQFALSKGAIPKPAGCEDREYEVSFVLEDTDILFADSIFRGVIGYWTRKAVYGRWIHGDGKNSEEAYVNLYSPDSGDQIIINSDGYIRIELTPNRVILAEAPKINHILINTAYQDLPTNLYTIASILSIAILGVIIYVKLFY